MNILSWNIFMNPELIEKRTLDICNIIKKEDPDVICLQEVVPQTYNIIKKELPTYYLAYNHIYINNSSSRTYGEMIMSKFEFTETSFQKLDSKQGRVVTWATTNGYTVGTGHLESYQENELTRQNQMNMIMDKKGPWIWIGDSNMKNDETTSVSEILPDSVENTYFGCRFGSYTYEARYDRAYNNGYNADWKKTLKYPTLSDHDGIMVNIS